jgi:hypothetical protein
MISRTHGPAADVSNEGSNGVDRNVSRCLPSEVRASSEEDGGAGKKCVGFDLHFLSGRRCTVAALSEGDIEATPRSW